VSNNISNLISSIIITTITITKMKKKTKKSNKDSGHTSIKAIVLVVLSTLFTSFGQILMKYGTKNMGSFNEIITNVPLISGFIIYGIAAVFLVMSLREGHLSVLYPFIALSFIWVTIASIVLFNDYVSILNWLGITSILVGVSLIGYGAQHE